jgi:outer membrane protein assembly factor BamB
MRRSQLSFLSLFIVATSLVAVTPAQMRATMETLWRGDRKASLPERCDPEPAVQVLGPASTAAPLVGATVLGDKAYVVTRGLRPAVLAEVDLLTRTVRRTVLLPTGEGAWATTVADGSVYVGVYGTPDVYRFDPKTGDLAWVARLGSASGYVWALTTAPDGIVYAATYPDGGIWELDPRDGDARRIARPVPGAQYARYVAADDTHVYASVYSPGRLVAVDRATHTVQDLSPLGDVGYGPIAVHDDRLTTTAARTLLSMRTDGTAVEVVDFPTSEALADALAVASDGTTYVTTRRSGSVWRHRPEKAELELVATPSARDEHRAIVLLDDATLFGVTGSGAVWWLDVETGSSEVVDLVDAGLTPGPERPQSIAYTAGTVVVGGHWGIEMHRLASGRRERVRVPGEPKAMLVREGLVYLAMYPSAEILVLDPATRRVRRLGEIGHGQQRPWDMAYDERTGLLVVVTAPDTGDLEGALTVVDPRTGDVDVYPGVLKDQALMAVDAVDGIAYVGGDVLGGGGVPPTRGSASIGAFDLRSRRLLWEVEPLPGQRTVQDLVVHDGLLYGVMKRDPGTWFAMHLRTRTVRQRGSLSGYGETFVHRGQVFAAVYPDRIYRLGPDLSEPMVVADDLDHEWSSNPQVAPESDEDSWHGWGLQGRDLARIRLDAWCPDRATPRASAA